jgi:hypothetical protein
VVVPATAAVIDLGRADFGRPCGDALHFGLPPLLLCHAAVSSSKLRKTDYKNGFTLTSENAG